MARGKSPKNLALIATAYDGGARRDAAVRGLPTLASLRCGGDEQLVQWARDTGRLVYIGRRQWQGPVLHPQSVWANPYRLGKHGTLAAVIAQYAAYLDTRPELLAQIPTLAGQVLVCWCHPQPCHGTVLLQRFGVEAYQSYVDACVDVLPRLKSGESRMASNAL